jgi:hypothetical protein
MSSVFFSLSVFLLLFNIRFYCAAFTIHLCYWLPPVASHYIHSYQLLLPSASIDLNEADVEPNIIMNFKHFTANLALSCVLLQMALQLKSEKMRTNPNRR